MAVLIRANGEVSMVHPANGVAFDLPELHAFVGGFIEILRATVVAAPDGLDWMVINEDGKGLGLPTNHAATMAFWVAGGDPADRIVGDALVCSLIELEGNDREDS
jgi:hypothetical protein